MRVIRLKFIILGLSLIIIGGVFLWFSTTTLWNDSARQIAGELASVLLISGIWTIMQEYFVKSDFEQQKNELINRVELLYQSAQRVQNIGLVDILSDSRQRNKAPLIESAKHFTLVVNDGRTIIGSNILSFQRRFSRMETTTRFVVTHPESEYVPLLAHKTGLTSKEIKIKINEACKILVDEYNKLPEDSRGDFKIYGHHMPGMFTVFLTEETLLLIPYIFSNRKTHVPLFEFQPKSEDMPYSHFKSDIESLIADHSELIFHNGTHHYPKKTG